MWDAWIRRRPKGRSRSWFKFSKAPVVQSDSWLEADQLSGCQHRSGTRCASLRFSNHHSEAILQLPHRMAQRRWRDTELRRRRSKAQMMGNSDECCQIGQSAPRSIAEFLSTANATDLAFFLRALRPYLTKKIKEKGDEIFLHVRFVPLVISLFTRCCDLTAEAQARPNYLTNPIAAPDAAGAPRLRYRVEFRSHWRLGSDAGVAPPPMPGVQNPIPAPLPTPSQPLRIISEATQNPHV